MRPSALQHRSQPKDKRTEAVDGRPELARMPRLRVQSLSASVRGAKSRRLVDQESILSNQDPEAREQTVTAVSTRIAGETGSMPK